MLLKILGSVMKDSRNCSRRYPGMFKKIPGNLNLDIFREMMLVFIKFYYQDQIATKLEQKKQKNPKTKTITEAKKVILLFPR